MHLRRKALAVGAVAVSVAAIGSGALITSNAMADTGSTAGASIVLVAQTPNTDGPIQCAYTDIPAGDKAAAFAEAGTKRFYATSDPAASPPPGKAIGTMLGTGDGEAATLKAPPDDPGTVRPGTPGDIKAKGIGRAEAGDAEPGLKLPPFDPSTARPGTPAECAALKPTQLAKP